MAQAEGMIETTEEGQMVVRLQGKVDLGRAGSLWKNLRGVLDAQRPQKMVLDLQEATGIDTAGVVLVRSIESLCRERGTDFTLRDVPRQIDQFLQYAQKQAKSHREPEIAPVPGFVARLGGRTLERCAGLRAMVEFIGSVVEACRRALLHPRRVRVTETLRHIRMVGAEAVPLVCSLSALMGMIMVFQGTLKMQSFGAVIYIADMVAIAVTREMAPLLTAVIISGRSGAAFAAEIGTMKLNQELDALEVMDFDIHGFLVLPRVFAMMVAGPLLTLLADAAGILGGMITSRVILGVPMVAFIHEIQKALSPPDIYTGIIKGLAFATVIGLAGCLCGLRTRMTADSVGVQTTSAVVIGILLLVLLDGLFAGVFQLFGW